MYNIIGTIYRKRGINMEYLTTVEMSKKWNITSRRIGVLCSEGRIEGAIKKGKTWLIPVSAVKPADARRKNAKGVNDGE